MSELAVSSRDVRVPESDGAVMETDEDFVRAFNGMRTELVSTLFFVLGNHEDAQDVAQEVFLKCWRTRDSLTDVRNLRAWIFRVSLNAAKDLQRNAWRRRAKPARMGAARVAQFHHRGLDRGEYRRGSRRLRQSAERGAGMNQQGRPTKPIETVALTPSTFTGNRALRIEEALIFEIGRPEVTGVDLEEPEGVAPRLGGLERKAPIGLPGLAEPEGGVSFLMASPSSPISSSQRSSISSPCATSLPVRPKSGTVFRISLMTTFTRRSKS